MLSRSTSVAAMARCWRPGFDRNVGLETKFIRFGCLICLAFSMIICYSYGGSPTQLILMANVATSIATPVGGLFILLLLWRDDVNEGYKKPTALRICMTVELPWQGRLFSQSAKASPV